MTRAEPAIMDTKNKRLKYKCKQCLVLDSAAFQILATINNTRCFLFYKINSTTCTVKRKITDSENASEWVALTSSPELQICHYINLIADFSRVSQYISVSILQVHVQKLPLQTSYHHELLSPALELLVILHRSVYA